ncbi:hypothetical protein [uncultured Aquimarina sp.]|uniref:hypothetical protein n=1 Tax=uncultured Aquimarina sp. TaxID=575652 RepID=UPI002635CC55|nr:hypothetical protein [uncultured Aquimarina sp.]
MILKEDFFLKKKFLIGTLIFGGITALSVIQIIPPSDSLYFERTTDLSVFEKLSKSAITFFKGVFFIPDFRTLHFWNTHLIVNLSKPFAIILGIISIFIPCFLFFKNKLVLMYAYLGILGTIVFFFVTQVSAPRFFGVHFLLIITGLWINHYYPFQTNIINSKLPLMLLKNIKKSLIYSMLITQLIVGITAFCIDLSLPFSNSKQTITYLKTSNLNNKMVITQGCGGTPLSSYLEKPIFFLDADSYESFCKWNRRIPIVQNPEKALNDSLQKVLNNVNQSVIFISTHSLNTEKQMTLSNSLNYKFLKGFNSSIVKQESYYIYEISKI